MAYGNLPGAQVIIEDGGLVVSETSNTESMLIIAPSLMADAPTEPVRIRNSAELVSRGFGSFYVRGQENPIAIEWKAAVDAGCSNISLVALKPISDEEAADLEADAGSTATGVLTGATDEAKQRRLFLGYYNLLMGDLLDFETDHVVVSGITVEEQVTDLVKEFFPEIPDADNFPSIPGFVRTSHILTVGNIAFPETFTEATIALKVGGANVEVELDGTISTYSELIAVFKGQLEQGNYEFDVLESEGVINLHFSKPVILVSNDTSLAIAEKSVVKKHPHGVIAKGSFAQTLGDYCFSQTLIQNSVIGYIGTKSPEDVRNSSIRTHVASLLEVDTQISPFLQIVAHEVGVAMPVSNQVVSVNGAAHYAALVSALPAQSATTHKQLPGTTFLRYTYSRRQLEKLTAHQYVTFHVRNNQIVVTDGVTAAPSLTAGNTTRQSDYIRLSTLRITQMAVQAVRRVTAPFIGEPNQMPQYNSLSTAVKSSLEVLRELGAITGYSFKVHAASARLDAAVITLTIIPAFELRQITVNVSLAAPEQSTGGSQLVQG